MNNMGPIAVFFTHGVSLELWEKRGMFSREVKFYEELAKQTGEIWFFTYGKKDAVYQERLHPLLRVFPKSIAIPNILYAFLIPFVYRKQLSQAKLLRIHQMAGAIPAFLIHWFFRQPLIVRCGYQWSTFLKHQRASVFKQQIVSIWERLVYHTASHIVVTTQEDQQTVSTRYTIPPEKMTIIPNYIDTDLFKPLAMAKEKRSICFVGRLEPQKNLLNLIQALKDTGIHLLCYGEGSQLELLKQHAKDHQVNVSFLGRIPNEELPAALNTCEIFILPSLFEGNPKVLLEAMACGLPVIGTNVEGISSIIQHNHNGILCEPHVESIRHAVLDLLDQPDKQQQFGQAARATIVETSSLTKAIEQETTLLQHSIL